ncbi:unnamed protein product [Taenia asiatica]|uniref:Cystatin domain-containing protein n=1 Tax=Taenia asiatica TaxID=60517 RepID=A0A0R3WFI6_TAEAS|nr:unnamed protein product [Taenia asiatica]
MRSSIAHSDSAQLTQRFFHGVENAVLIAASKYVEARNEKATFLVELEVSSTRRLLLVFSPLWVQPML